MKIYLVRHGQSKANEKNLFLGHGDLDLTSVGIEQAKRTAEYLKTVNADVIYSSDLLRAFNTAKQTADLINLPIVIDKGLREIDCGEWDFVPFDEIKVRYKEGYDVWINDVANARCDGGESVREVLDRLAKTVTKIARDNLGKTVLIFSHATAIRCFAAYCKSGGVDGVKDIPWANNASVTEVEYEDGKFRLIKYGKDDFMDGVSTGFDND